MHTVLCFVEDDAVRAFEDFIRHFHLGETILLVDLLPDLRVCVVEGRQTVQEDGVVFRVAESVSIDLIRLEVVNTLRPDLVRLTHGYPYIGADHVCILAGLRHALREAERCAGLRCHRLAGRDQLCIRPVRLRRAGYEMHAELRAYDHVGIRHVVTGVTHIHQFLTLQVTAVLPNRQHVGEHLRRVELVRETIPDRHIAVLCKLLYEILAEAAVLDAVVHTAQHACGIRDRLLAADLRTGRSEVSRAHAQVGRRHLEGAARSRRVLLEDQGDVLTREARPVQGLSWLRTGLLLRLQTGSHIEEIIDFLRCIVK